MLDDFNTTFKIGAIGYLPKLLQLVYPVKIIKYDQTVDEIIRNKNGFCDLANIDEAGEGIGLINDSDATRRFDG